MPELDTKAGIAVGAIIALVLGIFSQTILAKQEQVIIQTGNPNSNTNKQADILCDYNVIQIVGGTTRNIQGIDCATGKVFVQSTNASFVFNTIMSAVNTNGGGLVRVTGYNTTHPYNITSPIIIPDNGHLNLWGDGAEFTVFKIPIGSDNNLFQYSGVKTQNSFFNSFRDFEGIGNQGSGGVNNRGFVFNGTNFGVTDSLIYNIFLRNFKQDDIYFNGVNCWNNRLDSDTIELAGRAGLYLTGTTTCQDTRVLNTKFLYNNQFGIYTDVTESTYVQNWFYKTNQTAVKMNGESRSVWTGNRFMDNGIQTTNTYYDQWVLGSYNVITGNHYYGAEVGVNKAKYSVFLDTFENHNIVNDNVFGSGLIGTTFINTGTTSQTLNMIIDNNGVNPINKVTTPFFTPTSGTNIIPFGGNSTLPRNATVFTNNNTPLYMTVSGGTSVSIELQDGAGNVIQTGLTSITQQEIPFGYKGKITWHTSPNVTVWLK